MQCNLVILYNTGILQFFPIITQLLFLCSEINAKMAGAVQQGLQRSKSIIIVIFFKSIRTKFYCTLLPMEILMLKWYFPVQFLPTWFR